MCRASLIIERINQRKTGKITTTKIHEIIELTKANALWPLTVEGLLLLVASNSMNEIDAQPLVEEATAIANRTGISQKSRRHHRSCGTKLGGRLQPISSYL